MLTGVDAGEASALGASTFGAGTGSAWTTGAGAATGMTSATGAGAAGAAGWAGAKGFTKLVSLLTTSMDVGL